MVDIPDNFKELDLQDVINLLKQDLTPQQFKIITDRITELASGKTKAKKTKKSPSTLPKSRSRSPRKKLTCDDTVACKDKRLSKDKFKEFALGCGLSQEDIQDKSRPAVCDMLAENQGLDKYIKVKKSRSRSPSKELKCDDISACKTKRVSKDKIKEFALGCGLTQDEIQDKSRPKICDMLAEKQGIPIIHPSTSKRTQYKKTDLYNLGKKLGIKMNFKNSKADLEKLLLDSGVSDISEALSSLSPNKSRSSTKSRSSKKSRSSTKSRSSKKSRSSTKSRSSKKSRSSTKSRSSKNRDFNETDDELLSMKADELRKLLKERRGLGAKHTLPKDAKDIVEQYVRSKSCSPNKGEFCDEDKVCDLRSASKNKLEGFCIDEDFTGKLPIVNLPNGKKIIASDKIFNLIDIKQLQSSVEEPEVVLEEYDVSRKKSVSPKATKKRTSQKSSVSPKATKKRTPDEDESEEEPMVVNKRTPDEDEDESEEEPMVVNKRTPDEDEDESEEEPMVVNKRTPDEDESEEEPMVVNKRTPDEDEDESDEEPMVVKKRTPIRKQSRSPKTLKKPVLEEEEEEGVVPDIDEEEEETGPVRGRLVMDDEAGPSNKQELVPRITLPKSSKSTLIKLQENKVKDIEREINELIASRGDDVSFINMEDNAKLHFIKRLGLVPVISKQQMGRTKAAFSFDNDKTGTFWFL